MTGSLGDERYIHFWTDKWTKKRILVVDVQDLYHDLTQLLR